MSDIQTALNPYAPLLWLAVVAGLVLTLLWLLTVHRKARQLQDRLDHVLGETSQDSTAQMLAEYLSTVRRTAASVERMRAEHDQLMHLMPSMIRHVGLVRFSPFHDTGGDQSFTLALLDSQGNGVVITGLHSRHDSRLYAKPIEGNASSYSLTPEEREAMDRAQGRTPAAAR